MRRAALIVLVAGCSSTSVPVMVPADRPLLSWTGTSASARNQALLPKGFTTPDEHACAADPARAYLGELFTNGINNPQVSWHWAPVVGGPQAVTPTLGQPEFSLAGAIVAADDSADDVLADHPFGPDVDAEVAPDPAYGVLPFRHLSSTLLHTEVETRIDNTARFTASGQPFPNALVQAVELAVVSNAPRLTTHAMMVPNRFDSLDFLVCAPLPRPAAASLQASWRFTSRSGVKVQATQLDSPGCVRFVATMDSSYRAQPLPFATAEWSWQQLSDSASSQLGHSIDVRAEIIKKFNVSTAPALQLDHPPLIDAYAALQTRAGADQDAPTQLTSGADDQPFPLYGRVRVGWK